MTSAEVLELSMLSIHSYTILYDNLIVLTHISVATIIVAYHYHMPMAIYVDKSPFVLNVEIG